MFRNMSRRVVLSALGSDFSEFAAVPSAGASGGILIAWRRHIGVSGVQRIDNHSVTVQFAAEDGQAWWLTCVYGPQEMKIKSIFCRNYVISEQLAQGRG